MRKLIINADDFGVCWSTNEAIERAFDAGIVTSTTLMVPCIAAQDAMTRAKKNPRIQVGLHITCNAEWEVKWGPVSPAEKVPSMVDEAGLFTGDLVGFTQRANPEEVALEIEAQYQAMMHAGVVVDHVDSHMCCVWGFGLPSFMKETLAFCASHGLPMRFPRNPDSVKATIGRSELPDDIADYHAKTVALADALGVKIIDHSVSYSESEPNSYDEMKAGYFRLISNLPEGYSDLGLHPSLNPAWRIRNWEYRLLTDMDFATHIRNEGVVLCNYSTMKGDEK
ncbi:MAG: polysaccharide deacetylase family protein [Defluviitaleaceae bacterium]|nr:polysaccharide deacetylase family protein [Defluviitaleaceae bacterium]